MHLLSRKFLTAMRHVSQARPAPLIAAPMRPGFTTAPLILASLLLGSLLNPIIVNDSPDSDTASDMSPSISVRSHLDPAMESNSEVLIDTKPLVHPRTNQGRTLSHYPDENPPCPSHQDFFTIIPISNCSTENSTENLHVCLHNLRHIAKYHGFDLKELHPQAFEPPIQSSATTPVCNKIGPTAEDQAFLDNFDMENDVDKSDAKAVTLVEDIALLHEEINHRLHAALARNL